MEFLTAVLLLFSLLITYFYISQFSYRKKSRLPPGPLPFPIIGNILHVGQNPHRSTAKLSETYGPLMYLKLGSVQTIVVSSPEIAKQILQKHDQTCSARFVPGIIQGLGHHESMISWMNPGPKWRLLRKICKEELFTNSKLEATQTLRQQKLHQLHQYLEECCSTERSVNVDEITFVTALNLLSETLFSLNFGRVGSDTAREMTKIVRETLQIASTPNLVDFIPLFKPFDPQGLKHKTMVRFGKLEAKLDHIIRQRLHSQNENTNKKDLLQLLINLHRQNDSDLSLNDIKLLFFELVMTGTNTSSDTVVWAMSELLRNPETMLKAKNEVRSVIGEREQVEESDISKLPYLHAVIKETLRSHPPGPFLAPHKAEAEVEINGYTIPAGALILVNVWAIGRGSSNWSNPHSFQPERFLDRTIDYKGQDFEFLPFGSGRRICPGMPFAQLMVHLMVASLIHNFDWKLEAGMKPEDVDLRDEFGISLHKAVPLKVFPLKPKKITVDV